MKATLEFNLPEEQEEFDCVQQGPKALAFAWDLSQYLRNRLKYEEGLTAEQRNMLDQVRERLFELAREHGIEDHV